MKKIKYLSLFILLFMICIFKVSAGNSIKKISMDISVNNEGTAHIIEVWDSKLSEGTEGYHPYYNLGNSKITNFTVKDETGTKYTYVEKWDIKESFDNKKNKNGIYKTGDETDICWGITSYGSKTYTLEYDIENFIYNTTDNYQILFWQLIPYEMNPKPDKVYIKIYADKRFEDSLPVWGYGNYGGTAYVYDGYIEMQSPEKGLKSSDYMTILVQFPENFFDTKNSVNKSWDEVFNGAEEGTTKYKKSFWEKLWEILEILFYPILFVIIIVIAAIGSKGNEKIKNKIYPKKDVLPFRDLPFKDDYAKAYFIAGEYKLYKQKTDYLGAVILKWIKNDNVSVTTEEKGVFKSKSTKIEMKKAPEDETELVLYNLMIEAAKDDILEDNEFKKYCKNHYSKVLGWFDKVELNEWRELKENEEYIQKVSKKGAFGKENVNLEASDKLNEKVSQMAGLKKFFKEFTTMHDKKAIEVKMWRDYLIYAQIFGMAKEVAKEFKDLYPDVITDQTYNDIILIHTFSTNSVSAATSAKSRAESYSSGGGGFSSGGGGGGSFGGGGGGGGFR